MKKLLAVLLAILAMAIFAHMAKAQIIPSIPYNLTNGSLADATQVMGNFNTIVTDTNANAATSGVNTNITSLAGLTTPIAPAVGGTVVYTGGTTAGSANAQTLVAVVPSLFAQTVGNIVTAIAGFTNTASATLAVNSLPLQSIYKQGSTGETLLTGGEIVAGSPYVFLASTGGFDLINPTINNATAQAVLFSLGNTQGDMIYLTSTGGNEFWTVLPPGTAGQVLQTGGANANPSLVSTLDPSIVLGNGITASTQTSSDSSTKVATTAQVASQPGVAKAYVDFTVSGTSCTIVDSFNVSSVTYNSTGRYTVNFTNAIGTSSYAPVVTSGASNGSYVVNFGAKASGSLPVAVNSGGTTTPADPGEISAVVFK